MTDGTLTARVIGRSVRGASHVRTDKTNQDAMAWVPAAGTGDTLVVAVADGHGSAKSLRSDHGSALAVRIATAVLEAQTPKLRRPLSSDAALAHLGRAARTITERWIGEVRADLDKRPLSGDELEPLDPRELRDLSANPLLAYGTTLLAVVVTAAGVYCLQLGDGDIAFVARDGSAWLPLPEDARNAGNETLSLCLPSAADDFRYGVAAPDQAPRMILLSTDGFANSYQNESAFLKAGTDLARMVDESGLTAIEGPLEGWLQETTEHGAGDDVTLAVVVLSLPPGAGRSSAPAAPPTAPARPTAQPARAPTRRGRATVPAVAAATRATPPPPAASPVAGYSAPVPPAPSPRRRARLLAAAMLGGSAVLIFLILAFALGGDDEPDEDQPPAAVATQQASPPAPARTEPIPPPPAEPARDIQQCGTAFCVLDNEGFLWVLDPGPTWRRQIALGGGWTRMSVDGTRITLTRDGDGARTETPAPGAGVPGPAQESPNFAPDDPPFVVPSAHPDRPDRDGRTIHWRTP